MQISVEVHVKLPEVKKFTVPSVRNVVSYNDCNHRELFCNYLHDWTGNFKLWRKYNQSDIFEKSINY